jgi:hypothetical protein
VDAANNLSVDEQQNLIRILTHQLEERRRAEPAPVARNKTTTIDFDDVWDRIDEDE